MRNRALLVIASGLLASGAALGMTGAPALRPVHQDQQKSDRALAEGFPVGRELTGEACALEYNWLDEKARTGTDRSYTISCRGATSSRVVGWVTVKPVAHEDVPTSLSCGTAEDRSLRDGTSARAQQCAGGKLGDRAVRLSFVRGGYRYNGEANWTVAGPLEVAMVALASRRLPELDSKEHVKLSFDAEGLAKPSDGGKSVGPDLFNPNVALRYGTALNRNGLYVEAASVINDTLARIPDGTSATTRAELLLEAALADTNVGSRALAELRFQEVGRLKAEHPLEGERAPILDLKYNLYRAFHRLNANDYEGALDLLKPANVAPGGAFQFEGASLTVLNLPPVRGPADTSRALTAQEEQRREQVLLYLQVYRARSIAILMGKAPDRIERAAAELKMPDAESCRESVNRRVANTQAGSRNALAWIEAQLLRQCGRIDAARGDFAAAEKDAGQAADLLRAAMAASGLGNAQPVAEAQADLGVYYLKAGDRGNAAAQFAASIETVAGSPEPLIAPLPGIGQYLDMLIENDKAGAPDAAARFFRVMQLMSSPAVARQTAEVQSALMEGTAVGVARRERRDAERALRRISFRLAEIRQGSPQLRAGERTDLEDEEARQSKIYKDANQVIGDKKSETGPIDIGELKLRSGEAYLKLTTLPDATYGMVLAGWSKPFIYRVEAPTPDLLVLGNLLRATAAGTSKEREVYDVGLAYQLFHLLTGPAESLLASRQTSALVVDGSGPLENLPVGILVTDEANADAFMSHQSDDYTNVAFLAAKTSISTALSPRSFKLARAMPAALRTNGPLKPVLGLGAPDNPTPEHAQAVMSTLVSPNNCSEMGSVYSKNVWTMQPIGADGIDIAISQLGGTKADEVTGAAFADDALLKRDDLGQYMVLHFATHGLPEYRLGMCTQVPPSLVTSVGEPGHSDGLLSFEEVAGLKLNANLVVLSACETYAGTSEITALASGQEAGTTLSGLTGAFLAAQARAVIATYWQTPVGGSTNELMRVLYSTGREKTIGTSLLMAQRALMKTRETSHPYFWGAYFLVGDASKKMLSSDEAPAGPAGAGH